MNWVDGHCHLADPRPGFDPDCVIASAQRAGIHRFLQGGIDPGDWTRQLDLATRYPKQVFCACGLHPVWVASATDEEVEQGIESLTAQLTDPRFKALGELGLDARPTYAAELPKQERVFRAQLALAKRHAAPVILHVVRAHDLALKVLREVGLPAPGGMVHSFSGGAQEARRYVDLGLHLSVSGGNFAGGDRRVREAAAKVPADCWLVETDSPDQKHPDWEGTYSEPARLLDVARRLGAVLGKKEEAILTESGDRLERIFSL